MISEHGVEGYPMSLLDFSAYCGNVEAMRIALEINEEDYYHLHQMMLISTIPFVLLPAMDTEKLYRS